MWKKVLIILAIALVLMGLFWIYYSNQQKLQLTPEEQAAISQLDQLSKLKQQFQPLTAQQVVQQIDRLGELKQKYAVSPQSATKMTSEQIQQQLEEVKK